MTMIRACLAACLSLLLTSCVGRKSMNEYVPYDHLAPRDIPVFTGRSCGDAVRHALEMEGTAKACEADKAAVRRDLGMEGEDE